MTAIRTSAFFVANLWSEVARLQSALEENDPELVRGALTRARLIFEKLFALPLRASERAEITILQSVIEDMPKKEREFTVDAKSLESYFSPFAHKVLGI